MEAPLENKERQAAAIRRTVGIAALKRLQHMADADHADTAARTARARVLLILIVVTAALGLGFLLRHTLFG